MPDRLDFYEQHDQQWARQSGEGRGVAVTEHLQFELSREGTALLVAGGEPQFLADGVELWTGGSFRQLLQTLPAPPAVWRRLNRLVTATPDAPLSGWVITEPARMICPVNFSPDSSVLGRDTAYLYSRDEPAKAVFECPMQGQFMAANAGQYYCFSGEFAIHRCSGQAVMTFFDVNGHVSDFISEKIPGSFIGGRKLSDYAEVTISGRAPGNAVSISIHIEKGATESGSDSFLFFTNTTLVNDAAEQAVEPITFSAESAVSLFSTDARDACIFFPIWPELFAQEEGINIALVERRSGRRVEIQGLKLPARERFCLRVYGLQGSSVIGCIEKASADRAGPTVAVWVDGVMEGTLPLASCAEGDIVRYPLPLSVCDGKPHLFQFRDEQNGYLLDQFADFGPDIATPWTALQQYSGFSLPIHRAPAMAHRYRGLRDGLQDLTRRLPSTKSDLIARVQSLMAAHDIVVEGFARKRDAFPALTFPLDSQQRVSIVMPVHNKFEVTYNCLAALLLAHNSARFSVIIVDDGSTDKTEDIPDIAKNVTVIRNETPLGFVGACNRGALAAQTEFIVFLNNDTEPTANWLDELLFIFDNFDSVGLAGSKLLYADGRLQEAGGIIWRNGNPAHYGRGNNPCAPQFCYAREVDYLSGASLMIRRVVWQKLGGFSVEFAPAYFEDTDLAFKVRAAGYRVVFAPLSTVYHYEGLSNGTDVSTNSSLKRFQEINRPKFKRKWGSLFRENGEENVDADLAKDRGITHRVLMFDMETPRLDNDAGSYAAVQEIRLLQSLGFKVTFVPSNLAYLGQHTDMLQRIGVEMLYAPFVKSLEDFIESRLNEFDLVYITRYQIADRVADIIRRKAPRLPIICNIADLHFLRAIREAMLGEPNADKIAGLERVRDEELRALAKIDLVVTYSLVEQAVITSHFLGRKKVALIPWVLDPSTDRACFSERDGLAFLGGFGHPPNVSAVEFFVHEVMPSLREKVPNVVFRIYGSNIPDSLHKLAADDVIFEGHVADLKTVFDRCRVFVAPLRYGAGVKGKVLDCLAAGTPAVLSLAAAEALPIVNGREAFIVDKTAEWVEAIVSLYADETLWMAMSDAALRLASEHYSFENGRRAMSAVLEQVQLYVHDDRRALCVSHARPRAHFMRPNHHVEQ